VFDGTNPNGSWNLFVVDDAGGDTGNITGGWCLNYRLTCSTAANCDDGDPCTTDGCTNSACTHSPTGTPFVVLGGTAIDKQRFSWVAATNATQYDVVRGALNALPVGPGGGDELCFDNLSTPSLFDPTMPAPGDPGFWYLIRGVNACTAGSYGTQRNGTPRVTTTCP
jgi:hypothetical protein